MGPSAAAWPRHPGVWPLLATLLAAVSLSHGLHLHAGSIKTATSSPAMIFHTGHRGLAAVCYLKPNVGLQELKQWVGSKPMACSWKQPAANDLDRPTISTGSSGSCS